MEENSSEKLVLDATAFIGPEYAMLQNIPFSSFSTTYSVIAELKDFRSKANMEILKVANRLDVLEPSLKTIEQIQDLIKKFDPKTRLSRTDIEILALTRELKGSLMTNDYRLQNLAVLLNIPIIAREEAKIKKTKQWILKCRSCGHIEDEPLDNCPECGGKLRIITKKFQHKSPPKTSSNRK
ncbi:MAG: NOB1 family endonuclease [Candidatus Hodarchaeales archaeon]